MSAEQKDSKAPQMFTRFCNNLKSVAAKVYKAPDDYLDYSVQSCKVIRKLYENINAPFFFKDYNHLSSDMIDLMTDFPLIHGRLSSVTEEEIKSAYEEFKRKTDEWVSFYDLLYPNDRSDCLKIASSPLCPEIDGS